MIRNLTIAAVFLLGVLTGGILNSTNTATAHPDSECPACECPECPAMPVCVSLEAQDSDAIQKALNAIQAVEQQPQLQMQLQIQAPTE